ncbi:hypothetical protein HII31_07587 [Pseudocercospora fuligena]|uniref:Uncharacterized protein n=1 Tax=Pseudocercospora fuligena TaxID=685502 RepID=A0A8H6RHU6_9PEZI|nr:hypothetical protein HII31_07587 [Pseudocercospora fuligena]
MELHTSSQKPSGEKDRPGALLSQTSKGTIRNMSDFAKALRGNMAANRCSVEVPSTWSAPEDPAIEFNGDAMEHFGSVESTTSMKAGENQPMTMVKTPKPLIKAPEIEIDSRIVVVSREADELTPGPHPPQSFTIPADWEQAVSNAKSHDEILNSEGPEWVKLPEGGGWWKGNMTWI